MPIRVVSFDMEGTLIDHSFSRSIWEEEVPRLFSKINGLSLEESMKIDIIDAFIKAQFGGVHTDLAKKILYVVEAIDRV